MTPTDNLQNDGFDFDNEETFFGIEPSKTESANQQGVIKAVKDANSTSDSTDITGKKANKAQPEVKTDEEEADDDGWFGEKPKNLVKTPVDDQEVEEEDEEEDTEDDGEDGDAKDTKTKTQKKVDPAATSTKEDKTETPDDSDEAFYTQLVSEMTEKGILQNIELKDGEKITEEQFFELQDKEIEARVEETVDALALKLKHPDAKAFLSHLQKGGDPKTFINVYSSQLDLENIDVEQEAQRDKVLRHYMTTIEKMDSDEIEDKIKWLKDGGKDKATATKYIKSLETKEANDKKELAEKVQADYQASVERKQKFNDSLIDSISKVEEVNGVKITANDKKALGEFFTKPVIKVDKNTYVPAFQKKLSAILKAEKPEDFGKLVLLGKLLFNDFDMKGVTKKAETKVTQKIKSKLQETRGVRTKSSGGVASGVANLADSFAE